jgi:hypothetical protein
MEILQTPDSITLTIHASDPITCLLDLIYADELFDRDLYIEAPRNRLVLIDADLHIFEGDFDKLLSMGKETFIRLKDEEDETELIRMLNLNLGNEKKLSL